VQDTVLEPPSTSYYRQVFGCFFRDRHGLASLGEVGVDNITFETDYPHTDSTWPDTFAIATEMFAGLDVARHEGARGEDDGGSPAGRRRQDLPRQRDPHARPRPGPGPVGGGKS